MLYLRVRYGTDPKGQGFFWPTSDQKRNEYFSVKRARPAEAQSVYQCNPGAREGTIFTDADFCYSPLPGGIMPDEMVQGRANAKVQAFLAKGHQVVVSWDTAFEAHADADHTVGMAGLLIPCNQYHRGEDPAIYGECDPHFDVLILDVLREKLDWGALTQAFRMMHQRWQPETHVVEKRGSGISLYQSMSGIGINVEGVNAVESKRSRAIMGVGAGSVQGWFRMHRVIFPQSAPWLDRLKMELKDFTGAKDASDDQVDAMVHLVTKAILLSSDAGMLPSDWQIERVNALMGLPADALMPPENRMFHDLDRRAETLIWFGDIEGSSVDVFSETCARCTSYVRGWCTHPEHRRVMTAFDCCADFAPARVAA